MTFIGQIRDGQIVLEGDPDLPEGAAVRVEVVKAREPADGEAQSLGQKLMQYAGKAVGLPSDGSRNHDHYLYGIPKE